MKIFLIGMPGSGKTTLGRKLAEGLQLPFVDLDEEIRKAEGQSIPDIFKEKGEAYFRQIESTQLKVWAEQSESFVVATGGGAPCFHNGIDIINESGISVFLDVPVHVLLERVRSKTGRPLLDHDNEEREKKLIHLHQTRLAIYQKAKIRIENPDFNSLPDLVIKLKSEAER